MHVAVIGGAGYIGSHVVLALQDAGFSPVVFDNLSTGRKENTPCPLFVGDICNVQDLETFFTTYRPQAVIHLAAKKSSEESMRNLSLYAHVNIEGTINVLDAMVRHNVKTLIFSSTAAVYGQPQYVPMDEQHPTSPENFYGATKLACEQLFTWYGRLHGIRYAALRYFNAAGYDLRIKHPEPDPNNLFPILFETVKGKRAAFTIMGTDYNTPDGTGVRDYVHVSDLARAHLLALTYLEQHPSLVCNLGSGRGYSVRECVTAMQELFGTFIVQEGPRRQGDPAVVLTSNEHALSTLNWTPEYTEIRDILLSMAHVYFLKNESN